MDNRDLQCRHKPMINRDDERHMASLLLRGLYIMEGYLLSGYMDFTVQLRSMWQRAKVSLLEGKIVEKNKYRRMTIFIMKK